MIIDLESNFNPGCRVWLVKPSYHVTVDIEVLNLKVSPLAELLPTICPALSWGRVWYMKVEPVTAAHHRKSPLNFEVDISCGDWKCGPSARARKSVRFCLITAHTRTPLHR